MSSAALWLQVYKHARSEASRVLGVLGELANGPTKKELLAAQQAIFNRLDEEVRALEYAARQAGGAP